MDAMIDEDGEEGVLARVMTRIAIGDDPREIALGMGMPWYVLRKWLEDKPERMQAWELAKRCFADGLVYESLKEVRDCGLEEVPLARLRSETYQKTAGKVTGIADGRCNKVLGCDGEGRGGEGESGRGNKGVVPEGFVLLAGQGVRASGYAASVGVCEGAGS
jgi:hypothetical protein